MRLGLAVGMALVLAGCLTARPGPPWPGADAVAAPGGPLTSPLPLVPVRLGGDGALEGVVAEMRALDYCGMHNATGLRADYGGDPRLYFQAVQGPDAAAWGERAWYANLSGQPVRPGDIPPGSAAVARWRTPAGWEARNDTPLLLLVVHLDRAPVIAPDLAPERVATLLADGFAAFPARSPASPCCLLGWSAPPAAARADAFDVCSPAAFDPYRIVPADVPPRALVPGT